MVALNNPPLAISAANCSAGLLDADRALPVIHPAEPSRLREHQSTDQVQVIVGGVDDAATSSIRRSMAHRAWSADCPPSMRAELLRGSASSPSRGQQQQRSVAPRSVT